ncbi:crotonase/enoyl-CoA hydratase family protein [Amycolatopsis sp. K13G38]|uniref:Crotonase/enoyl-CoA hydratase family protein n=1 Tax=Amycolatopsis acididurans TaxID=2724524 RepID=A0ABX1JAC2_9PSEU|nr:crotonase/enoyl-CoA hydratase family protein [Amycolatopsis acididurans]NKQ56730.1 crotonase/enoyl-CoA hydratase family protein [Amycolatopsis acididurans]
MGVLFEADPATHVAVITIDRPEARNAVNGEVATGIEEALDAIEADDDIWVSILTGTPPVFSAGADLKVVNAGKDREMRTRKGGFAGLIRRERVKPLIAAVDGHALAGGTEIVLACDLVVASTKATFGLPEVKRCLVAGGGGLFRLGRKIPITIAMEWALTGEAYPATRAYEVGLVNELCEPGQAVATARKLAERITVNAPLAVQYSRDVVLNATSLPDSEAWQISNEATRKVAKTNDFKEGVQAFIDKRPPEWTAS